MVNGPVVYVVVEGESVQFTCWMVRRRCTYVVLYWVVAFVITSTFLQMGNWGGLPQLASYKNPTRSRLLHTEAGGSKR